MGYLSFSLDRVGQQGPFIGSLERHAKARRIRLVSLTIVATNEVRVA